MSLARSGLLPVLSKAEYAAATRLSSELCEQKIRLLGKNPYPEGGFVRLSKITLRVVDRLRSLLSVTLELEDDISSLGTEGETKAQTDTDRYFEAWILLHPVQGEKLLNEKEVEKLLRTLHRRCGIHRWFRAPSSSSHCAVSWIGFKNDDGGVLRRHNIMVQKGSRLIEWAYRPLTVPEARRSLRRMR